VISNWDERLRPLLTLLDLDTCFSVILISCEFGAAKPSPLIFQEAARQLRLPPESLLHIGDSEQDDLEGARAAGLKALRIDRCQTGGSDGRISRLEELRRLVGT
jgi:putative hydrolase of the HAD superfamily